MGGPSFEKNFNQGCFVPSLVEIGSVKNFLMYFHYVINMSPSKEVWPFICFVPSLVEIDPMVLERKILKFCQCIFIILLISHLGKERGLSFEQNWIPFSKGCLVSNLWKWPSGSGEESFLNSSMYFHNYVIISLWKRAGPFIWTNLSPYHPRMLCAKFTWN